MNKTKIPVEWEPDGQPFRYHINIPRKIHWLSVLDWFIYFTGIAAVVGGIYTFFKLLP